MTDISDAPPIEALAWLLSPIAATPGDKRDGRIPQQGLSAAAVAQDFPAVHGENATTAGPHPLSGRQSSQLIPGGVDEHVI